MCIYSRLHALMQTTTSKPQSTSGIVHPSINQSNLFVIYNHTRYNHSNVDITHILILFIGPISVIRFSPARKNLTLILLGAALPTPPGVTLALKVRLHEC